MATFEIVSPDELWQAHNQSLDEVLIARCRSSRPTLIFWVFMGNLLHSYCYPKPTTLFTLRTELEIPIALFLPDAHDPQQIILAESFAPYLDFIIHALTAQTNEKSVAKYIRIPHSKDPRVFNDPLLTREFDVCFAGSYAARPLRLELLQFLEKEGIAVHKVGGQREQPISSIEFAEALKRSKIALNIMDYGYRAINGRIMEATLCGSLLFNAGDSETNLWLTPEREFVQAETKLEVLARIRYLLAHDQERSEIARRGHEKALQLFDGRYFWQTIIDRASRPTPFKAEEAWTGLGCYLDNLGDLTGAGLAFKTALEINPNFVPAFRPYALNLTRANRLDLAHSLLEKGTELPDSKSDLFLSLAKLCRERFQPEQMVAVARKALTKFTNLAELNVAVDLAKILLLCKDFSAAQDLCARAFRLSGTLSWQRAITWAAAYFSAGQVDQAAALMVKISDVELSPDQIHQEIEDTAGLLSNATFSAWAKEQFKPSRVVSFSGLVFLGFVAEQRGKLNDALSMYKAIQQLPEYSSMTQANLVEARIFSLEKVVTNG